MRDGQAPEALQHFSDNRMDESGRRIRQMDDGATFHICKIFLTSNKIDSHKSQSYVSKIKPREAARPKAMRVGSTNRPARPALYTPQQRERRDGSVWTLVQGILAPVQFLVFLVSLGLILRFLWSGEGQGAAEVSVVIKTLTLYTIMITGAIWEKAVFGQYLFARAFFWEDVFSMLVLGLHTAYLVALHLDLLDAQALMILALAAYATYVVNAGQFVWKLRLARLDKADQDATAKSGWTSREARA